MALCEHEYIAKVLGFTIQDEIHVGIIMPLYCQSLEKFLKDDENQPLQFLDALRFVWQTASVTLSNFKDIHLCCQHSKKK